MARGQVGRCGRSRFRHGQRHGRGQATPSCHGPVRKGPLGAGAPFNPASFLPQDAGVPPACNAVAAPR